jgi:hypothetical protein
MLRLGMNGRALAAMGILILGAGAPIALAANSLGNPSFESPQGTAGTEIGGGAGDSWSTFNAVFLENNSAIAHQGNQYIKVFGGGSGAFQDIPVNPGDAYSASSWAQLPSADHAAAGQSQFGQLLVIFRNPANNGQVGATQADNTVHFGTGGTDTPSDVWNQSVLSGTVPAGAAFIRFQLNEGASAGGAVFFDDTNLTVTPAPEPASIGLLAGCGITLLRRRRR